MHFVVHNNAIFEFDHVYVTIYLYYISMYRYCFKTDNVRLLLGNNNTSNHNSPYINGKCHILAFYNHYYTVFLSEIKCCSFKARWRSKQYWTFKQDSKVDFSKINEFVGLWVCFYFTSLTTYTCKIIIFTIMLYMYVLQILIQKIKLWNLYMYVHVFMWHVNTHNENLMTVLLACNVHVHVLVLISFCRNVTKHYKILNKQKNTKNLNWNKLNC